MSKFYRSIFSILMNNRGEIVNGVETPPVETPPVETPAVETPPVEPSPVQPTTDWEADDNPYKKRYADSQGQIQPIVRTLSQFAEYDQATKTWKPKPQLVQPQKSDEDVEKLLEGYDPEFVKVLKGYISPLKNEISNLRKEREESVKVTEYNSGIESSRKKAIEEFGGEFEFAKEGQFNSNSPLYKLANEILTTKYSEFNPDGTFYKFKTSDAEYMATVEAYAIISKRAKNITPGKEKLGAIAGKGTSSAGIKKALTLEEYSKLTDEQKDAYDASQVNV